MFVIEQLLVNVGAKGRVDDAISLTGRRPGCQVFLVALLSSARHVQFGQIGEYSAKISMFNGKEL